MKPNRLRMAVRLEELLSRAPRKVKNDPELIAAARELRDRWLEEVNSGRFLPGAEGKYGVTRPL